MHTFFKGVTLDKLRIEPLNKKKGASIITGDVEYANLTGLVWSDLLFGKTLKIDEITFVKPIFDITLRTDTVKKSSGSGIQGMFGDILSRVDLKSFEIQNGSMVLREANSEKTIGKINRLNVEANELQTDSLKFTNPIPFKL